MGIVIFIFFVCISAIGAALRGDSSAQQFLGMVLGIIIFICIIGMLGTAFQKKEEDPFLSGARTYYRNHPELIGSAGWEDVMRRK